jgi:hypothetical protein
MAIHKSRAEKEVDNNLQALKTDSTETSHAESEIIQKAQKKTNFQGSAEGGINVAIANAKASAALRWISSSARFSLEHLSGGELLRFALGGFDLIVGSTEKRRSWPVGESVLRSFAGACWSCGGLADWSFRIRRVLLPPHFRSIVQGMEFRFSTGPNIHSEICLLFYSLRDRSERLL